MCPETHAQRVGESVRPTPNSPAKPPPFLSLRACVRARIAPPLDIFGYFWVFGDGVLEEDLHESMKKKEKEKKEREGQLHGRSRRKVYTLDTPTYTSLFFHKLRSACVCFGGSLFMSKK